MTTHIQHDEGSLTLALINQAHARISSVINHTPVLTSETLDRQTGAKLYFKCENFQKVGAFKARGAANAVLLLEDEQAFRGVVTHSSGNHAAALARAAALRGIPAYLVMPDTAPKSKQAAVRRYGGNVILCPPTLQARESTAERVVLDKEAIFIHPYDNLHVMAGQGTTAVEFLSQVPDLDVILCPVGGGGLLSGCAVVAKNAAANVRVIAVEPSAADDAYRSFKAGYIIPSSNPITVADGLLTSLGDKPFAEIRRYVDDVVTVSEAAIVQAMRLVWEVLKIVVEPSAAVGLAALVEEKLNVANRVVGIILTGGNLDLDKLPWQK